MSLKVNASSLVVEKEIQDLNDIDKNDTQFYFQNKCFYAHTCSIFDRCSLILQAIVYLVFLDRDRAYMHIKSAFSGHYFIDYIFQSNVSFEETNGPVIKFEKPPLDARRLESSYDDTIQAFENRTKEIVVNIKSMASGDQDKIKDMIISKTSDFDLKDYNRYLLGIRDDIMRLSPLFNKMNTGWIIGIHDSEKEIDKIINVIDIQL